MRFDVYLGVVNASEISFSHSLGSMLWHIAILWERGQFPWPLYLISHLRHQLGDIIQTCLCLLYAMVSICREKSHNSEEKVWTLVSMWHFSPNFIFQTFQHFCLQLICFMFCCDWWWWCFLFFFVFFAILAKNVICEGKTKVKQLLINHNWGKDVQLIVASIWSHFAQPYCICTGVK